METKWNWTELRKKRLNWVLEVIDNLHEYLPLTLRQVYYQLVGKGLIENKVSTYGMLSGIIKWGRLDGFIPWDCIEDRVRAFHDLSGYGEKKDFIDISVDNFLEYYRRDLMQGQDYNIEVWIEKDALSSLFKKVAYKYTIPVVVCRGFSSISFLHSFKERVEETNVPTIMLYFGDFDPSGVEMLEAMKRTLKNELEVRDVIYKRIALSLEDIEKYNLPHDASALKRTDTRSKSYIEKYGEVAVELDALPPDVLVKKIETAIEDCLDMHEFREQKHREKEDIEDIGYLKNDIERLIEERREQI